MEIKFILRNECIDANLNGLPIELKLMKYVSFCHHLPRTSALGIT